MLERYHRFYGDDFTIEYPTGSGPRLTLARSGRPRTASRRRHAVTTPVQAVVQITRHG